MYIILKAVCLMCNAYFYKKYLFICTFYNIDQITANETIFYPLFSKFKEKSRVPTE